MRTQQRTFLLLLPAALLTACGTMQPVADDVYYLPSKAPALAAAPKPAPAAEPAPAPAVEDYYDAGTSEELGTTRSYYDVAYNDPHYYNYGRFGFNAAPMGWQTGWNGPGWGGGMGWRGGYGPGGGWYMGVGYGSGVYSGWNRPLGYYDPWAWNSPWGWNSPMGWNNGGWGYGYGYGYGYGQYYSPWGNCYGCYSPVIISDRSSNRPVVQHRNSVGSRNGTSPSGGSGLRRTSARNPVGLTPAPERRSTQQADQQRQVQQPSRRFQAPGAAPSQPGRNASPQRERNVREVPPSRGVDRSSPSRSPSFGGGGGGGGVRSSPSSPSRGGGGGGNSGGGGGSRSSPGRR